MRRTVEDWILVLLGVQKDKPISGKLAFVKELFLLEKEVVPKIPGENESFEFYPYDYGPYSTKFARVLNELIRQGLVEAIPIPETKEKNFQFRLTEAGIVKAEEAMKKIPSDFLDLLARKRRGWDQLGHFGITRRVYSRYPEYTIRSKIREEVMR
ncbi:MAG: hypothetical protein E3J35_08760 [Methanomassiliicoccales archaeon]|nr:MAG: hypothetical protein E3J35_08760 [Methanomassiliicoccales archaeon]